MRWLALITVSLASMLVTTAYGQSAAEPSPRPIVVEVHDDGFDWADAGIGGAAVLGLVMAGAGAALVVRRADEPTHSAEGEAVASDLGATNSQRRRP